MHEGGDLVAGTHRSGMKYTWCYGPVQRKFRGLLITENRFFARLDRKLTADLAFLAPSPTQRPFDFVHMLTRERFFPMAKILKAV